MVRKVLLEEHGVFGVDVVQPDQALSEHDSYRATLKLIPEDGEDKAIIAYNSTDGEEQTHTVNFDDVPSVTKETQFNSYFKTNYTSFIDSRA